MAEKDLNCDLHIHTTASGGIWSPVQIVRQATKQGLNCIAITDVYSVSNLAEAQDIARPGGLRVIPGVELTACYERSLITVLGYFVDPDDTQFQAELYYCRTRQRPLPLSVAVELINSAMGLAVLADPVQSLNGQSYSQASIQAKISQYRAIGLIGVEVYRPKYTLEMIRWLEEICTELGLICTGGSDFYTPIDVNHQLGCVKVPTHMFNKLHQAAINRLGDVYIIKDDNRHL